MPRTQRQAKRTLHHIIATALCACALALGGVLPTHAAHATSPLATPAVGALTQNVQPTRLIIPSLDVDAAIEAVGQDDNDEMGAPSTVNKVAWYNLGPTPGEPGNAAMAGHLDDVKGNPAVFWALDALVAGDEILVQMSDGREIRFTVMSVETYDADAAPMNRIFGVDFERDLNLITCDGVWNAQSKLYAKRLVVYARRIQTDQATETAATGGAAGDAVRATTPIFRKSERVHDPAQTRTSPLSPIPSPAGSPHARQDRGQPLAAR